MYKIMLVDDDYPVLMYLAENIPWEQLGMKVIGTFANGFKALEEAKRLTPDVLITDIGMPKMNGLELIEQVNEINPQLLTIILSCHDDFKYAQKAIKLKVDDYILKETINVNIIVEKLQEFKIVMEAQKNQSALQTVDAAKISKDELSTLKTQWIRNTLKNEVWDMDKWKQEAFHYGIDLTNYVCIPVMGYISHSIAAEVRSNMSKSLIQFASENIINELIRKYSNIIFFPHSQEKFFLFLMKKEKQLIDVSQVVSEIQVELERVLSVKSFFILGKECKSIHQFRYKLLELWNAHDQYFYQDEILILQKDHITFSEDIYPYYLEILDNFRNCLFEGDKESIELLIEQWLYFCKEEFFHPKVVKDVLSKVLIELQIKMKFILPSYNFQVEESIYETLSNFHLLKEIQQYVAQYLNKSIFLMEEIYKRAKRKEILDVQRYIISNIDRNITLNEVANLFHLNHSYLSRLFKKETGENFVEYMTRMKIKRAKELLDKSNKSVEEISEKIGYEKGYFYRMFKRATGVTPNEYRTYY